jgi:hypothetical protein
MARQLKLGLVNPRERTFTEKEKDDIERALEEMLAAYVEMIKERPCCNALCKAVEEAADSGRT